MEPQSQEGSISPIASPPALDRRGFLVSAGLVGAGITFSGLLTDAAFAAKPVGGTITFWDMPWGAAKYEGAARALCARYEKENPGIKVKYSVVPWATFYETFLTAVVSGTTPDVSTGAAFQGFQYVDGIAPLNPYISGWRKTDTISGLLPGALNSQRDGNRQYKGLPWNIDLRVIHYNSQLAKATGLKLPTTLTQLRTLAAKMTTGGVYGFGFAGVGAGGYQELVTLLINNGGGLFDKSGNVAVSTDRNREVFDFLQGMVTDKIIPPEASALTSQDLAASMSAGKVGISINNPGAFSAYKDPNLFKILSPVKGFHGNKGTLSWNGPMFMYKTAKNKAQVAAFMSWWVRNMQSLWTDGGAVVLPNRSSFYKKMDYFNSPQLKAAIADYAPIGRSLAYPYTAGLPSLNQIEGSQALPQFMQDILTLKPIDASINRVEDALNAIVSNN